MSQPGDDMSVQVALRVRPQSASEKIDLCHICTSVTPGHPQVVLGKDKAFTYDYVFDIDSAQQDIYNQIARPLIEGCFEGYNATILAYGQTGSGKTYTMGTSFDIGIPENLIGIIPRAAKHLFEGIQTLRKKADDDGKALPEFKVTAQFLELYNEEIIDLLDIESKGRKIIKVHEDHNGLIYMTGVVSKPVTCARDCMTLLEEGAISRTTAATNMNATSSRSHAIFTLFIKHYRLVESSTVDGNEFETLNAKFNFVDLAGSERLKRTGATGDRAKEGISINQGLLSLGNVISALGDKSKRGSHVPYRDSKLTRLLQDSLGGNSRTLMIACISPSDRDFMETLNTLKYANRARNIKNKVMVNQDKASKQIALLRQEIQQLTLELLEYKQGKRIADADGEHVTDTFNELEMLRGENEKLRMQIKALQHNIDSQVIQLTELKVTSALAGIAEGDRASMEDIVKGYEKKIIELSNKVQESEAMSNAALRRAQTVSKVAMSPGSYEDNEEMFSILQQAKEELKKEKKKKKKLSNKVKLGPTVLENQFENTEGDKKDVISDDTSETQQYDDTSEKRLNDNTSETRQNDDITQNVLQDEMNTIAEEDEVEEVEEDAEDEEELVSNTDSDSDDELNQSLKEETELQNKISDLDNDIDLKQKLIDELEHSQQKITALKHSYEEKMQLLHNKIKETENERDKILKAVGSVDAAAREKADAVRKRFEKKLLDMQKELKKYQNLKRDQQNLQKAKEQNEQQLKLFRNEVNEMKKQKVKLMHQMRDEVNRNKLIEGKLSQQMESMLKENRKKDVELKRLKQDAIQRDLVLKRKQEEINAIRKQVRPISGNITSKSTRSTKPVTLPGQFQSQSNLNATFVVEETNPLQTPTKSGIPTAQKGIRSPAVSKKAKHKWEILDRKITETMLRMKNVAQIENDMERFMIDREKVSRQLDSARKRLQAKEEELNGTDLEDSIELKELRNQVEGMEAHMDYIQENIKENQGVIMDIEEEGQGVDVHAVINSISISESRYLLEHFYSKAIETATELANKDAAYKEIQIKLEAMEKHCEVQQQLLQHACKLEGLVEADIDDEESTNDLPDVISVSGTRKNRRKTALPEELLHPKENKKQTPPVVEIISDDEDKEYMEKQEDTRSEVKPDALPESLKLDEKTLRKLQELEKKLNDRKKMPPPPNPGESSAQTFDASRQRSGSFSESLDNKQNTSLPTSFQRNTRISRSARPLTKTSSGSNLKRPIKGQPSNPLSNKTSPLSERRIIAEPTNVGQILPAKLNPGSGLHCQYTATGHNNAILSLDVLGDLMVTGSKDRTAKVWDLNTSEEIMSLSAHKRDVTVVKFCPSNKLVYTVSHSVLKVWDLRSGICIKTLGGGFFSSVNETNISDIGLNRDGSTIYSAVGTTVKMIDLKTFSSTGKLTGHQGTVTCLLVTDTGRNHNNVITGSKDHSIRIFEIVDEVAPSQVPRQSLEPPHYDGVESLSMQNNYLFSGSRDNTIKKWSFSNHVLEHHFTYAHKDWVTSLNFVPNMDVLLSGDRKGIIKLWHTETCKPLGEIEAHGKSINAIKCNADTIFTASSDRLVRIWKPSEQLQQQVAALVDD